MSLSVHVDDIDDDRVLLLGEDNRRIQVQTLSYLRQTNGLFLFGYGTLFHWTSLR